MAAIKEEVAQVDASVIITINSPCMLLRRAKPTEKFKSPVYIISADNCHGCKMCLEINCPAISWREVAGAKPKMGTGGKELSLSIPISVWDVRSVSRFAGTGRLYPVRNSMEHSV